MAGTTMRFGTWKRRVGDAVELRLTPEMLGLSPAEVGSLVKRGALPVHTFRTPDGVAVRLVRRADLDMVKASMRQPQLRDVVAAIEVMAAQP
jgi:hypothetical protein